MKRESFFKRFLTLYLPLIVILLFILFPFYWTFITSIKPDTELYGAVTYWPRQVQWENYTKLFTTTVNFLAAMKNSFIVAAVTTVVSLTASTLASYAFSRYRFAGRRAMMALFLSNNMFPTVLLLIPLYSIMRNLGLLYTPWALVLAYTTFTLPFSVWLLNGFFNDLPLSLEEAALVDGCNRRMAFFKIILPILGPCLVATGVYIFMTSWNEYTFAVMFTNNATRTIPVALKSLIGQLGVDWGLLTAGGIITIIPKELRQEILKSLFACQSGHPGGSLSCVEILMALYYDEMKNLDPKDPKKADRDRLVLSKGHACPTLYAILADLGYFPKEDLAHLRQIDSHLQGHPDCNKTPGVDMNTGSLGQGMSLATGLALAAKHAKADYKVYAVVGDGECQEGIVWEAAMAAAHYKLDNLCVLLDYNGLQIDGTNDQVMGLGNIVEKFKAFGFECFEVDGHNIEEIDKAIEAPVSGKPKFICCHTIKGKGVSFMENQVGWHGRPLKPEEFETAMKELEA